MPAGSVAPELAARGDEIGVIAASLAQLRDAATQAAAPVAPAAVDRREDIVRAETFSREFAVHVGRLGGLTRRLGEAAEAMIVTARHANDGSDRATSASSHAAGDVASVATASEQLLDSIEEISRQVVQSTSVVKAAVERAVDTNAGMGPPFHRRAEGGRRRQPDLAHRRADQPAGAQRDHRGRPRRRGGPRLRGRRPGGQDAGHADRQGDAGHHGQITEMQEATDLSVEAIDKIQKKISEVEHISTIIAAAVHEQGAATQEIARNVRSAAAARRPCPAISRPSCARSPIPRQRQLRHRARPRDRRDHARMTAMVEGLRRRCGRPA